MGGRILNSAQLQSGPSICILEWSNAGRHQSSFSSWSHKENGFLKRHKAAKGGGPPPPFFRVEIKLRKGTDSKESIYKDSLIVKITETSLVSIVSKPLADTIHCWLSSTCERWQTATCWTRLVTTSDLIKPCDLIFRFQGHGCQSPSPLKWTLMARGRATFATLMWSMLGKKVHAQESGGFPIWSGSYRPNLQITVKFRTLTHDLYLLIWKQRSRLSTVQLSGAVPNWIVCQSNSF